MVAQLHSLTAPLLRLLILQFSTKNILPKIVQAISIFMEYQSQKLQLFLYYKSHHLLFKGKYL